VCIVTAYILSFNILITLFTCIWNTLRAKPKFHEMRWTLQFM
jgi:hypothetical protein